MSFTEKSKIVNRGSLCIARDCKCSKLLYHPYLISVACSKTELSILVEIWRSGKGSFSENTKIINRDSLCSVLGSTGAMLHYEPYLFSVACSYTELSILGNILEIR